MVHTHIHTVYTHTPLFHLPHCYIRLFGSLSFTNGALVFSTQYGMGLGLSLIDGREDSSYLPPHMKQTINRVELQAVIQSVLHYHGYHIQLSVCTDCAYVFGGVEGTALRWRATGWVTSCGPVACVSPIYGTSGHLCLGVGLGQSAVARESRHTVIHVVLIWRFYG